MNITATNEAAQVQRDRLDFLACSDQRGDFFDLWDDVYAEVVADMPSASPSFWRSRTAGRLRVLASTLRVQYRGDDRLIGQGIDAAYARAQRRATSD